MLRPPEGNASPAWVHAGLFKTKSRSLRLDRGTLLRDMHWLEKTATFSSRGAAEKTHYPSISFEAKNADVFHRFGTVVARVHNPLSPAKLPQGELQIRGSRIIEKRVLLAQFAIDGNGIGVDTDEPVDGVAQRGVGIVSPVASTYSFTNGLADRLINRPAGDDLILVLQYLLHLVDEGCRLTEVPHEEDDEAWRLSLFVQISRCYELVPPAIETKNVGARERTMFFQVPVDIVK